MLIGHDQGAPLLTRCWSRRSTPSPRSAPGCSRPCCPAATWWCSGPAHRWRLQAYPAVSLQHRAGLRDRLLGLRQPAAARRARDPRCTAALPAPAGPHQAGAVHQPARWWAASARSSPTSRPARCPARCRPCRPRCPRLHAVGLLPPPLHRALQGRPGRHLAADHARPTTPPTRAPRVQAVPGPAVGLPPGRHEPGLRPAGTTGQDPGGSTRSRELRASRREKRKTDVELAGRPHMRFSIASAWTARWRWSPAPPRDWAWPSRKALAEAGADVAVAARRADRLEQTRAQIEELGAARDRRVGRRGRPRRTAAGGHRDGGPARPRGRAGQQRRHRHRGARHARDARSSSAR